MFLKPLDIFTFFSFSSCLSEHQKYIFAEIFEVTWEKEKKTKKKYSIISKVNDLCRQANGTTDCSTCVYTMTQIVVDFLIAFQYQQWLTIVRVAITKTSWNQNKKKRNHHQYWVHFPPHIYTLYFQWSFLGTPPANWATKKWG